MHAAEIIAIGTELALGRSLDTNSAWLARELAALGYVATRHVTVADDVGAIVAAIRAAVAEAKLVIITGGLGPTADDCTRDALAQAAGVTLACDEAALTRLEQFFAARRIPMPPANRVQVMIPAGGQALPNPVGTAPGIRIAIDKATCYVLPGVPREMETMFAACVRPELVAAAGSGAERVVERKLNTHGLPEAEIGTLLADLMAADRNPIVGTTAQQGIIGVRIYARGDGATTTRMVTETEAEVRRRLGVAVFGVGDETLAEALGTLLRTRGATLATAESCTGGLIGADLTSVPGSSDYYLGGAVCYANAVKIAQVGVPAAMLERHGAVSAPVAEAMAQGVAERLGATYGLSITGIAGPGGGSDEKPVGLVFIGLHGPGRTEVWERRYGAEQLREVIRRRSAHEAEDRLRRRLLAE